MEALQVNTKRMFLDTVIDIELGKGGVVGVIKRAHEDSVNTIHQPREQQPTMRAEDGALHPVSRRVHVIGHDEPLVWAHRLAHDHWLSAAKKG